MQINLSPQLKFYYELFPPSLTETLTKSYLSTRRRGDALETFVAWRLARMFPYAYIANKVNIRVAKHMSYECDIVMYAPAQVPLLPKFYIIECKNHRNGVRSHYICELWWKIHASMAGGGMLFTTGSLSERSLNLIDSLGITAMKFNQLDGKFYPMLPRTPRPPFRYLD